MISLNWVGDYIDIKDQNLEKLATKITRAGINVEEVITNHIDKLIIGEVVEVTDHPDSDHLNVCTVDIGNEKLQIVCGASNVRKDIKVIVALEGAILPGNFEIKKSKIRGVNSCGMICALFELGLEEKTEENYNKGITELDSNAPIGEDPLRYLNLNDTLYDLDVHKHRNNDCYSHIGFAYEIAAILNRKVTLPDLSFKTTKDKIKLNLDVKTNKCSYYLARSVKDVVIKESPEFIKKRLIAAGMRPINNVVDISNYVMLEFGQPLHFFDKDKLGDTIIVRDAKDNEKLITLDGEERVLTSEDIVIANDSNPVCLAGVMGGENTEVDENTKNIIIEAAIFNPISIRNTSKRCNLSSEASIRYGKGLNYEYTEMASRRACHLLEKYADAKIDDDFVLIDNEDKEVKKITFKSEEINKLLGIEIKEEDMKIELERLDFKYSLNNHIFEVEIPKRRLDIEPYVNDLAEEIGRLYGYNNLDSILPTVKTRRGVYADNIKYRKLISKRLRTLGLTEVKTYTLVSEDLANMFNYEDKEKLYLPNPMNIDKSVLRTSLIPSLINVYEYNKARSVEDVLIYEISKTYDKNYKEIEKVSGLMSGNYLTNSWSKDTKVDFYLVKGIIENILDYMGYKNRYSFIRSNVEDLHPGISADIILDGKRIGILGKVHPSITKDDIYIFEFDLDKVYGKTNKLKYKEAFKYPSISKDMAYILDKDILVNDVIKTIKQTSSKILQSVDVFDVYEGDNIDNNKKSVAFKLLFNGKTKTLTDEEVMIEFNKIICKIESIYNAILRDK